MAQTLEKAGVTVWRDTVVSGEKDYSAVLTKVKSQNPDILFFASKPPPDHTVMVRQMKELGIDATYFGTEGARDKKEFIEASEGSADGGLCLPFFHRYLQNPGSPKLCHRLRKPVRHVERFRSGSL